MAKKYIDTELLLKEIEKYYDEYRLKFNTIGDPYYLGLADGLDVAQRVIDSLQQEQTCDMAIDLDIMFRNMKRNEAIKQLEYLNKVYGEQPSEDLEEEIKRYIPRDQCPVPDLMEAVARHFYELGKGGKV